jgi:formylglycine-generating enzyme required for sulfatase activity
MQRSEEASIGAWQEANSPRETVSWFEAMAFCRWLSQRTGSKIRLPTEWEWQQAATGGDSTREYPWPGEWDASRCNSCLSSNSKSNTSSPDGLRCCHANETL